MTKLSVNVNKFATLRNARGGNNPDLMQIVRDCEKFGAEGITIHPRPDERHITEQDVFALHQVVTTEFNIEGYPDDRFLKIIKEVKPKQVTLVPDSPDVLTSNAGWDTILNESFLRGTIGEIKLYGIRVSIFVDPVAKMIEGATHVGADRIELYTESYATKYSKDNNQAVKVYVESAELAKKMSLGINAGHDLNLDNLKYLRNRIPFLDEVSIGHALVCDALYFGLENTIQMYRRQLK